MKREWLIQLRKSKKMTQEYVSSVTFINRAYYAQIESGKRSPSFAVAKSIADVLDFNPIRFFQDDIDQANKEHSSHKGSVLNQNIPETFKTRTGLILYLFNHIDVYYQHAIKFLLTGVENGRYCFLFDNKENVKNLHQYVNKIFDKNKRCYVKLINLEEFSHSKLENIVNILDLSNTEHGKHICVWVHGNPNCFASILNKDCLNTITLFVVSYNSSMLTASSHIDLMRKYPYLMTDKEIVDSPLYKTSTILPSLYIQDDL
ncbi:helix-turn-helix transcriptional regulator [Bacillus sp. FJAT-29814]|uniref:helix-turn-helix transcriptional regulator n=1 Tax=Bacillus sp. FJAT-29814 TaxID=1729688 RepID=UPI0009E6A632|nr:helix-turn-helix domain-containing protein [Bacillus sp. FJAT-29814]